MNAVNPYAPPKADLDLFLEGQYWRDGKTLVLRRNSALPPRCVKCNAVADGEAAVRKLRWGSLLTLHYRKVKLDIPLCATHSGRYRRARSTRLTLRWLSASSPLWSCPSNRSASTPNSSACAAQTKPFSIHCRTFRHAESFSLKEKP